MGQDKCQLLRLVFIDKKIREGMQTGRLANCATMAAEYEVSAKTIMRDIDYLKNQRDAPLAYDASQKGYYYTEQSYTLPAISLNESDLFAVCIAQKALEQHENTPIYDKLAKVFEKIEACLPEKVTVQPTWVDNKVSVIRDFHTRIDPYIWEQVSGALASNRRLRIEYRKPGGKGETREVDPYHVTSYQGEWYMIGYCYKRKEIRTFAISRIKEASQQNGEFEVAEDFDLEDFRSKRFGIFGGEEVFLVRIYFAKEHAPYVLERKWHPTQEVWLNVDGSIVLQFEASHLFEVKRWILSWGGGAKVLEPVELARSVQLELEKALAGYQSA